MTSTWPPAERIPDTSAGPRPPPPDWCYVPAPAADWPASTAATRPSRTLTMQHHWLIRSCFYLEQAGPWIMWSIDGTQHWWEEEPQWRRQSSPPQHLCKHKYLQCFITAHTVQAVLHLFREFCKITSAICPMQDAFYNISSTRNSFKMFSVRFLQQDLFYRMSSVRCLLQDIFCNMYSTSYLLQDVFLWAMTAMLVVDYNQWQSFYWNIYFLMYFT